MKTSFSRIFLTASVILVLTLVLIGFSFQILVKNYLTESAMDRLESDGQCISSLVQAYSSDTPVSSRDFHIALSAATTVSGADAVDKRAPFVTAVREKVDALYAKGRNSVMTDAELRSLLKEADEQVYLKLEANLAK